MRTTCTLLLLATRLGAAPGGVTPLPDPAKAAECRVRDGLPNVFAKLKAGEPVRIAYLGGSITAAAGWRPKSLAWLRAQWPQATISELNCAISGTGSDYSACRLRVDVLDKQPDLVFLECRVNGGGGFERQSVEGVVRAVWAAAPRCDICFVYTIGQWMVPDLTAGRQTGFGRVMETVANAYGIPSVDFGVEVAKRIAAGELSFLKQADKPDLPFFASDGAHPNDAGHNLYRDVLARAFGSLAGVGTPGDHALPAPLGPDCWQHASLAPLGTATLSAGWTPVDKTKDPVYRDDYGRTDAMLRGAVKCSAVGESVTVQWTGQTVGFSDIPYGADVELEAAIDGGKPFVVKRTQYEKIRKYARFWYLPAQTPGPHTVVVTVKSLPAGQSVYLGHLLLVGLP